MKKGVTLFISSFAGFILVACATSQPQNTSTTATTTATIVRVNQLPTDTLTATPADNALLTAATPDANNDLGGNAGDRMDSLDKSKFSHALDAPLGKSSTWINSNTRIQYTVTPTAKITVGGNPYCRQYSITASRGQKIRQNEGSACVNANSNWQAM